MQQLLFQLNLQEICLKYLIFFFFFFFFIHSLTPCLSKGGGEGPGLEVGITASTITSMIIPMAVKTFIIVIPCSLNNVLNLSPSVVSFLNTLLIVSFILFISLRNASLFALAASSLTLQSSSKFFKRVVISCLAISSSASCIFRFSFAISLSISVSFAKLFASSPRIL